MTVALKVDEQRPSSDLCGEIIGPDTSIKCTSQESQPDSQAMKPQCASSCANLLQLQKGNPSNEQTDAERQKYKKMTRETRPAAGRVEECIDSTQPVRGSAQCN
jgi:hypothetical protein